MHTGCGNESVIHQGSKIRRARCAGDVRIYVRDATTPMHGLCAMRYPPKQARSDAFPHRRTRKGVSIAFFQLFFNAPAKGRFHQFEAFADRVFGQGLDATVAEELPDFASVKIPTQM